MTAQPQARRRPTGLVQCGWCPLIMADDDTVIRLHFSVQHRWNGYSVKPLYGHGDWTIEELLGPPAGA